MFVGWMKMCMVASLFLGYQMLIITILGNTVLLDEYLVICQVVGFLIQYFFLSAFCWMSAMSGEVWSTFRQLSGPLHTDIRDQRRRFYYFKLYSWGLPGLVSFVTVCIHLLPKEGTVSVITPGVGYETCFFHGYAAQMVYFHGIIAIMLTVNLLFFLASSYALLCGVWASAWDTDSGNRNNSRQMFWVVMELFLVMGLTWLADVVSLIISWNNGKTYSGWEIIIFDIINSLQGLLIFIVFICKPRIRKLIGASLAPVLRCLKHKLQNISKTKNKEPTHSSILDSLTPTWRR